MDNGRLMIPKSIRVQTGWDRDDAILICPVEDYVLLRSCPEGCHEAMEELTDLFRVLPPTKQQLVINLARYYATHES